MLQRFLSENHLKGADELVQASYLECNGDFDRSQGILFTIEETISTEIKPLWFFLIGNNLREIRKMEDAEIAYKASIKLCDNQKECQDWLSSVWSNLASTYEYLKDHERAIECVNNALKCCLNDKRSSLHRFIGTLYAAIYDSDNAISEYQKAIEYGENAVLGRIYARMGHQQLKKNDFSSAIYSYKLATYGHNPEESIRVLNNLGYCYSRLGNFATAAEAYKKAMVQVDTSQVGTRTACVPIFNLARAYVDNSEFKQAKTELSNVRKRSGFSSQDKSKAKSLLPLLNSRSLNIREFKARCEYEKMGWEANTTCEELISIKLSGAKIEAYADYKERKVRKEFEQSAFTILRDWSSALPLLDGSSRQFKGGGYFLQWNSLGIVLDPGFDFLCNFHDAGFLATQINHVVVSHDHTDHNRDLRGVDDLLYEIWKRNNDTGKYTMWLDKSTDASSHFPDAGHRSRPKLISRTQNLDESVLLESINVKHDAKHALAFKFTLSDSEGKQIVIGYTGDTAWFPKLGRFLFDCDVLIAHISHPENYELLHPDSTQFKANHLGYLGVCALIQAAKPKITLIGEFWAGLADVRLELVRAIRERTGSDSILPAASGLRLLLPRLSVECGQCFSPTAPRDIRVTSGGNSVGSLQYRCTQCLL